MLDDNSSVRKICLVGNPNTGKSSIFNFLTGLRQHVGNFPGVTVERKQGVVLYKDQSTFQLIDLPGTYSLVPQSEDERVVYEILFDKQHEDHPTELIYVLDSSNLERNLFLFTQLYDQGWPMTVAMTMTDFVTKEDFSALKAALIQRFSDVRFISINAREGDGIVDFMDCISTSAVVGERQNVGLIALTDLLSNNVLQRRDATFRYNQINQLLGNLAKQKSYKQTTSQLDKVLVHPVGGYVILLFLLLMIFQAVFHIASYPMDWIDAGFGLASGFIKDHMPGGVFTNLLADGVVPGIGGVVVFVPQIALLFLFLAILEETGYMSRVVFLTDRLVRPFGLSGRSIVPLISSAACAIPGVMAARTIPNFKDKLITIFVAPFMSCSARIPVYTLLIALVIPDLEWGFFKVQGLVLFVLYALGIVTAFLGALVLKFLIKSKDPNFLLLELPRYQWPRWSQVGISIWSKVKVFVWDAGKVILAISILLWVLASYGPSERLRTAEMKIDSENSQLDEVALERLKAEAKLENSYIGIMGKSIEPIIEPLGYDWKIGIALITSFAAREVFVGSMATIYSVGEDEDNRGLLDKMRSEKTPQGTPRYSLATGLSLMVFYAYAMQCMATLAVVRRETNGWKWPIIQLVAMGVIAYLGALLTFNLCI
jgi:ferrous iron transport protein B